jgi:hypothetical protein
VEAILFYAYMFAINLEDLSIINEKQLKLCRILYSLVSHNLSFEDRMSRAETSFDFFISKL